MKKQSPAERARIDLLEQSILDTFAEDAPPHSAKLATMAALGVGAAVMTAPSVGAGASALSASSVASSGVAAASTVPSLGPLLVLKWVGVGMIAGTVGLTPAYFVRQSPQSVESVRHTVSSLERAPKDNIIAVPTVAVPTVAVPTVAEPVASDVVTPEPAAEMRLDDHLTKRNAALRTNETGRAHASQERHATVGLDPVLAPQPEPPAIASVSPSKSDALGAEIGLLDEARRALASSGPPAALALLQSYENRFPHGAMAPEATVLRVEAWMMAGNRAEAARVASQSITYLPSKYAERVRALLEK